MWRTTGAWLVWMVLVNCAHAQQPVFEQVLGRLMDAQHKRTEIHAMFANDPDHDPEQHKAWNADSLLVGADLASAMNHLEVASAIPPASPLHSLWVGWASTLVENAWTRLNRWG